MSAAFHTLWRLAAGQPQLPAAHVASYAALVRDEGSVSLQRVLLRGRLQALALAGVMVGAVLAGVALMLWAVLPSLPPATAWVLWAAPGAPLAVALLVWALQLRAARVSCFSVLRQQWQADLALLRGAAAL